MCGRQFYNLNMKRPLQERADMGKAPRPPARTRPSGDGGQGPGGGGSPKIKKKIKKSRDEVKQKIKKKIKKSIVKIVWFS